jgi:DHA1 family bicyclomycin/chloramphenicol resistance-like MFS transporter
MADRQDLGDNPAGSKLLIAILVAITALGPASTQIFLPALPVMQTDFAISAATAQLTLSLAFLAMAFTEIGYGPLSDRRGRRPILIFGLLVYLAGCAISVLAPNVWVLLAGRVLQASGGSVGIVLSRAIAVDVYGKEKSASIISLTTAVMALAPMLAPFIGGLLTDAFGWRSTFILMIVCALMILALVTTSLAESHEDRSADHTFGETLKWFGDLMRSPIFTTYAFNAGFTMGIFFSFIASAPYVVINVFKSPAAEFGLWFMLAAAGYIIGSLVSARISKQLGIDPMVVFGSLLSLLAVAAMGFLLWLGIWENWAVFGTGSVAAFAAGMTLPNAQAGAVQVRADIAGTASGLVGFILLIMGAGATQLVGVLQDDTPFPMAIGMGLMALLACGAIVTKFIVVGKRSGAS